jgi:predicted esterase
MFGIMTQDGLLVLCHGFGTNTYLLKRWDRAAMPVMRKSALEIDQLFQNFMTSSRRYDMTVFEFTEDQIENLLIKKLKGY